MFLCITKETDPYFNLAFEEYILTEKQDEFFLIWQNRPSVIIGKNQNALKEVDIEYVKSNKIDVVRRISGGGAVFHDLGNINYSYITKRSEKNEFLDFSFFTLPVISALKPLGINAVLSGRNDITIDGKKISGNAQCIKKDRILHHGTLLFSASMSNLELSLKPDEKKLSGKGIKSVKSRVTNISSHLKKPMTVNDFILYLTDCILALAPGVTLYEPTEIDIKGALSLSEAKYKTYEWNFGQSPEYSFRKKARFDSGEVEVVLLIKNGIIQKCRIFGDFFGKFDVSEIENSVINKRHEENALKDALSVFEIGDYLSGINKDDFIKLFL